MRDVRVHSPAPLAASAVVRLAPGPSEHLLRVLRLRPGARFTVFDGTGGEYPAELEGIEGRLAVARLGAHEPVERESPLDVTLLQALLRAEKMDWVVQKATELGVRTIAPVEAGRSVVQLDDRRAQRRTERWREIAIAACEQCGRNRVPDILEPRDLSGICAAMPEGPSRAAEGESRRLRLVLAPGALRSLAAACRDTTGGAISLLIGPEGGLTDAELAAARRAEFEPVHLGPRVLRAETAALAALATLQATIDG
jgi:16S rRNA (uracil1498-N3)-methyltransferase